MSTCLLFFISLMLGWLLVAVILRKLERENLLLYLFLAIGLGLGCSSLITFFSFWACNGFNRFFIFFAHLFTLAVLSGTKIAKSSGNFNFLVSRTKIIDAREILYAITLAGLFAIAYVFARSHPFGEWDGWAVWNMKTKFLTLSADNWKDTFQSLHPFTQPDYPLLLPFLNVWGGIFLKNDFVTTPLLTSVIFTVSCTGLLFAGLLQYVKWPIAFIGASLLFFLPPFLTIATAQYADILLAYYLLASCICLIAAIRQGDKGFAMLTGLFLGLMSFTKNEGIMMAVLLLGIGLIYLVLKNPKNREACAPMIALLLGGFVLTSAATVIFKVFWAPPNRDIVFPGAAPTYNFFNLEGCYLIITSLFYELFFARWHFIWFIVIGAIAINGRRYFAKETRILSIFFIAYAAVVFFVYLTTINFDLMWRLSRTLPRILFYLLPAILFSVFYIYSDETGEKKYSVL